VADAPLRLTPTEFRVLDLLVRNTGVVQSFRKLLAILESRDPDGDSGETVLSVGSVRIELPTRQVSVGGSVVPLTPREFDLLVLLARRPGTVVHREQIIGEVWPATGRVTAQRTLDVHIASLRGKLRLPALIETVRGVGYRLAAPAT
jgi:DNA-binding response OmpR family regulator